MNQENLKEFMFSSWADLGKMCFVVVVYASLKDSSIAT